MATSREQVLLECKNSVKLNKTDGSLVFYSYHMSWKGVGSDEVKFRCSYSDIKAQRISSESSSKVKLQVVLHDGNSINFQFINEKGREMQLKERNEAKELLAQLIPAHRKVANKEIEEKNRILRENPELYQLYKDLVTERIITAEEFWENRNLSFDALKESPKQDVGISSGFLAEIKPDIHGCNELRFNLTADSIDAIFKTYPALKRKYEETVPDKMTEKEFWTEFFRSQHFHRDRYASNKPTKDLLGECAKTDEQEQLKESMLFLSNPLLDMMSDVPISEEGYGGGMSAGKISNLGMIRSFNHQSLMVLKNAVKRNAGDGRKDEEEFLRQKRTKLLEATEIDDLESKTSPEASLLQIVQTDKFSHMASSDGSVMNGEGNHHVDLQMAAERWQQYFGEWEPDLPNVLTSEAACAVMAEMAPNGKLMNQTLKTNLANSVPVTIQDQLKYQYTALAELLRHFWSCFPVKTPQLEEKVARMGVCLQTYSATRLDVFRRSLPAEQSYLTDHLYEMLNAALNKYQLLKQRRTGTKAVSGGS